MKHCKLFLICLFLTPAAGCGEKQYPEDPTCDDLALIAATDVLPPDLTDERQAALDIYESLSGRWSGTWVCPGGPEATAEIRIDSVSPAGVEFYDMTEDAQCNSVGVAVFEATLSGTANPDMDDVTFYMTADLLGVTETGFAPSQVYQLQATSETRASTAPGVSSFSLKVRVDYDGLPSAVEFVTTNPVSGANGSVSYTQGERCTLRDWVPSP